MKKIEALRVYLTSVVPGLANDPERLFIKIESGHIVPRGGTPTFRMRATVTVTVLDVPDAQIHDLAAAILFWAATNQPELLALKDADEALPFQAEGIGRDVSDVAFSLRLEELVSAEQLPDGTMKFIQRDEPDLEPGWPHLDGWKTNATLIKLFAGGDQVLGPTE